MHEYDVTLKLLLEGSAGLAMRELTDVDVARWLNVELPKLQHLRVDLLGETGERELVHIELQSSNDASMALRMAEYCFGVYRLFRRLPRQILLYVGEVSGLTRHSVRPHRTQGILLRNIRRNQLRNRLEGSFLLLRKHLGKRWAFWQIGFKSEITFMI